MRVIRVNVSKRTNIWLVINKKNSFINFISTLTFLIKTIIRLLLIILIHLLSKITKLPLIHLLSISDCSNYVFTKKKFNAEKDAVRNSVGSNSPMREN